MVEGNDGDDGKGASSQPKDLPFPSSLCHLCAAPPRYVTTDKGNVFIQCPVLKRYPPQPVRSCEAFTPMSG
ncbi:MAG: hypothetical protein JJE39_02765 [Vicinamibacteria bacterium]|nr:hypothetical protein [Vicinamibacteria bacterium]